MMKRREEIKGRRGRKGQKGRKGRIRNGMKERKESNDRKESQVWTKRMERRKTRKVSLSLSLSHSLFLCSVSPISLMSCSCAFEVIMLIR